MTLVIFLSMRYTYNGFICMHLEKAEKSAFVPDETGGRLRPLY